MRFLLRLAWRDLSASGPALWVFCACLALGVALVSATGGLYRQVSEGLLADTRQLAGGDLEVSARAPLPPAALEWLADHGTVSRVTELDTMMVTPSGALQIVELQSVDDQYPLYGELRMAPAIRVSEATRRVDGIWGVAVDPVLAERHGLSAGDRVELGQLSLEIRAVIRQQPDRRLTADWRGAPVIIAEDALEASGLMLPGSRIEYEYRVRTGRDPEEWRDAFFAAFPDANWEVRTFAQQSRRIAERLGQVASGLLIIGFSTLFIGGLGVFNSVHAYLQSKLGTIATLRSMGLRDGRLAAVYLLQIGLLGGAACLAGAVTGFFAALAGAAFTETQIRVATAASSAAWPAVLALGFGLVVAFTCSLPAIGRALSVPPAALFRSLHGTDTTTPRRWWLATAGGCVLIVALVAGVMPDAYFALAFMAVVAALLGLLELIVRGVRRLALALDARPALRGRFTWRLALANLHRPGSALRTSLLSLGSALTLLVACTVTVSAIIETIASTIPRQAPALVLYDIAAHQRDAVAEQLAASGATRVDIAPLVQARLTHVNGEPLAESVDPVRRREARDEHKLTYPANNIDDVALAAGEWWPAGAPGGARAAMEDREAEQLGLAIGDRLIFNVEDRELNVTLGGIYRQRGLQTRFWFEAIVSEGVLDPFISRYVAAAYMDDQAALQAQAALADVAPNVVTVRTAELLATARDLLGKATGGLAAVAAVALAASLLVLTSVVAASRARQVYDATILHVIGARLASIRRSLHLEYLLLAVVTACFALAVGTAVAVPLLVFLLKLPPTFPLWPAAAASGGISLVCLSLGARYLMRRLRLQPALLLRSGE